MNKSVGLLLLRCLKFTIRNKYRALNICSNDLNTLKIIQSAPEIEGLNDQPPKGSLVLTNLTSQMIAGIETDLKSASWKERLRGLESLEHVLQEKPAYVLAIFEVFNI